MLRGSVLGSKHLPPSLSLFTGRLSQRAPAEAQSLCTWARFPNSLFSRKLGVAFPNPFLMKLLRRPVRSVVFSVKTVTNVCERLLCARHCAEPFRCIISFNLKMARGVSTAIILIFKMEKLREQRQYVIFGVTKLFRDCNTGLEHVFFFKTLLSVTHIQKSEKSCVPSLMNFLKHTHVTSTQVRKILATP